MRWDNGDPLLPFCLHINIKTVTHHFRHQRRAAPGAAANNMNMIHFYKNESYPLKRTLTNANYC